MKNVIINMFLFKNLYANLCMKKVIKTKTKKKILLSMCARCVALLLCLAADMLLLLVGRPY